MASIEKSIEVEAPLTAVYNQWTQFEDKRGAIHEGTPLRREIRLYQHYRNVPPKAS